MSDVDLYFSLLNDDSCCSSTEDLKASLISEAGALKVTSTNSNFKSQSESQSLRESLVVGQSSRLSLGEESSVYHSVQSVNQCHSLSMCESSESFSDTVTL